MDTNRAARRLAGMGALCALLPTASGALAAPPEIGIYRDELGTSCSFSGNTPGAVTAYVVFFPDARGFRAVRFSAPVPSCFDAVWLRDIAPERMRLIGDSQSGISASSSWCEDTPMNVLQIQYYQNGSTSACCPYPVLADPYVNLIEVLDCEYGSFSASATSAYFNADPSCRCGNNHAPDAPFSPVPAHAEQSVSVFTALSWSATDPDDNLVSYDVYLGTGSNPPLAAAGLTQKSFQPPQLDQLTTYIWRVVARDEWGAETSGADWWFTTRLTNSPPNLPFGPAPANGSAGVLLNAKLTWQCSDIDGDTLTYDVHFGTDVPPPRVAASIPSTEYDPALTWDTYYYWRIIARDGRGHTVTGPLWGFRTRPENWPPEVPSSPSPANGATGRPVTAGTLTWACSDRDVGDAVVYDVYFGSTSPPPRVATGRTTKTYSYGTLSLGTLYYWKIVARDSHGAETQGPEWHFTTRSNAPPAAPSAPAPANGGAAVSLVTGLSWQCSDPDGDTVRYDVYFGTASTPPKVASNISTKSYTPGTLAFLTTYYWRIVARDPYGAETSGVTWSFTTKVDGPPPVPSTPSPAHAATNVALSANLSWVCTDPDAQTLSFDVYFGTDASPPLVAGGITTRSYRPASLAPLSRYYWRVVARDPGMNEAAGPTWYFNTRTNTAPNPPSSPSPGNGSNALAAPVLAWYSYDPDGQALTYDVYFGDVTPPPLAASGLTEPRYEPGELQSPRRYYWSVVVSDGFTGVAGPVWNFTTVVPGDVDLDGRVTVADAKCAMDRVVWIDCGSYRAADVDCSGLVTARDARCIHRRALAMGCPFCGEGAGAPAAPASPPVLSVVRTWDWGDTLYCRLAVRNVPALESFGFNVTSEQLFIRAQRRGVTNEFASVRSTSIPYSGVPGIVAGYSLTGTTAPADAAVEFIDLRFLNTSIYNPWVTIDGYSDDLAGAAALQVYLPCCDIAVLIRRFDAVAKAGGVEISWEVQSDEALEGFTLYRRSNDSPAVAIAQGSATTLRHFDRAVSAGSTYEYELVIRASGGDEFRSQKKRVTLAPMGLALHPNHPNPFNPQTTIPYYVPAGGSVRVRLAIYDTSGRLVRALVDESQTGGAREVVWRGEDGNGKPVTSGVYFCVLQVDNERRTRKLVLLK
jgi:hypothetical protein